MNCWGFASVKLKHLAEFKYFIGLEKFTLLTLPYFKGSSHDSLYQLLYKDYWKTWLSIMLTL